MKYAMLHKTFHQALEQATREPFSVDATAAMWQAYKEGTFKTKFPHYGKFESVIKYVLNK